MDHVRDFHRFSPYRVVDLDEAFVEQLLISCIEEGGVFINADGFIAGKLSPLLLNPNVKTAAEIAWWCPNGNGRELKNAFESWAKDQGAVLSQFSVLNNDFATKLHTYLTEDGYSPIEVAYVKDLQ